jgi:hypothetical protein
LSYRYKHIELALAETFKVTPEDMPAFRARLRHLRNLGVPAIPPPGSGQKIDYERSHAVQLLIALETELLGLTPLDAASFSRDVMMSNIAHLEEVARMGWRMYMSVDPSFALEKHSGWVFFGSSGRYPEPVAKGSHRGACVDIATSIRMLDSSLKRLAKLS